MCSIVKNAEGVEHSGYVLSHTPPEESGLGRVEYDHTLAGVSDEADPLPKTKKPRTPRGTYSVYTPENRALIGKYALKNGNKSA